MKFVWEITFGQIVMGVPLGVIIIVLMKMFRILLLFRMEHEMLMQDWALRQNPPVKLVDLHTRKRMWW